ncbi:MAG: hypothetical protein JO329_13945 [Planctomycetaceae bacterium]|nr:hypothetical protein [Planctomycetaceae bacterium]
MPGTSTSQPPNSLSPQLKADLQKLWTDEHTNLAKSQVTVAQIVAQHDDNQQIAKDATSPPSQAALQALQTDAKAVQGSLPTAAQQTQLETDYTNLLKSEGVTDQTLISKAISDDEAIVKASGITSSDLQTLASDRTAIKNDFSASHPAGATGVPIGVGAGTGYFLSGLGDQGGGSVDHGFNGGTFGGPIGNHSFQGRGAHHFWLNNPSSTQQNAPSTNSTSSNSGNSSSTTSSGSSSSSSTPSSSTPSSSSSNPTNSPAAGG